MSTVLGGVPSPHWVECWWSEQGGKSDQMWDYLGIKGPDALGNAVVPQVSEWIGKRIMESNEVVLGRNAVVREVTDLHGSRCVSCAEPCGEAYVCPRCEAHGVAR